MPEPPHAIMSQQYCEQLASQVSNEYEIPLECKIYPKVVETLRRRMTKSCNRNDLAIAFAGMPPGTAYSAMSNVERGHLHHAQIQRKPTNRNEKGKQW